VKEARLKCPHVSTSAENVFIVYKLLKISNL
jgi:hypothetical protein